MRKTKIASSVIISCLLLMGASTAFAQADQVPGVKYQTNEQGQRVNSASGIQGSKEQVNNLGEKVNTAGGIQGSKDQVNDLGDHVNTAGGSIHLTVGDKTIDGRVYNEQNATLIPLRIVAETLGYVVTWKGASREIELSKGNKIVAKIKEGKDEEINSDNKAYVSTDFLVNVLGLTVTNNVGNISIE